MTRHSADERELETTRPEGDTASRAVAIDRSFGSELLELHPARYPPGRSQPPAPAGPAPGRAQRRRLEGAEGGIRAGGGGGRLGGGGAGPGLEPMPAAYLVA